jgi:hypothetical protein
MSMRPVRCSGSNSMLPLQAGCQQQGEERTAHGDCGSEEMWL